MRSLKSIPFLFLIGLLVLTGCQEEDKENPRVTVLSPAVSSNYHFGDEVHVEALFEDDKELASYTMWVGDINGDPIPGFSFEEEGGASGKSQTVHSVVILPDSLDTSLWFLHYTLMDAAGKTGSTFHLLHVH